MKTTSRLFIFLLFFLGLLSALLGHTTSTSYWIYKNVAFGISFRIPTLAYAENRKVSPQKATVTEKGNTLSINAAEASFKLTLVKNVSKNNINSMIKNWFGNTCEVYNVKGTSSGNNLNTVTFGPINRNNQNDDADICVPGTFTSIKYEPQKNLLIKIEASSQDCVFYNAPGAHSTECTEDLRLLESMRSL